MLWRRLLGGLVMSAIAACAGAANATVRISGTPEQMALQAQGATMAEIASAIEARLAVRIGLKGSTERHFTGVYTGSLRGVLSRLLMGVDHLVRPVAGGVDVVILDPKLMRPGTGRVVSASRAGSDPRGTTPADDGGEPAAVEGWIPKQDPYAEARAAAAKTAARLPTAIAQVSLPAEDSNNGVQGWVPRQDPYAEARAAAAKSAVATPGAAAQPSPIAAEPHGGVQGWVPTRDPYAAARAAAAKQARDNAAKAPQQPSADKPASRPDALLNRIRQATSFGERQLDLGIQPEERSHRNGLRLPSVMPSFAPFPQSQFGPRGDDP